ncbi:uncharacterized protein LOC117111140 [Anneissia japonica]|uniref:uncharacterized protein LOC117111140 n=1 Tax=Anneissia japonica TaxID=1529436 RepID=UPI0014256702|nr:uncharacterized protein LOC117111140 [Anneissia japonica]
MRHLLAFRPQEVLAIDFLKIDKGRGNDEDILVMTDVFTKCSQAVACKDQTACTVAKVLRDCWFCHYGIPLRIHSDQGSDFEGHLIREMCKLYGIQKTRTSPYHPLGNSQVERFNSTLCGMIRSLEPYERRRWPELLNHLVYICTIPHHIVLLGSQLMSDREPTIPLDQLLNKACKDWDNDYVQNQADTLKKAMTIAESQIKKTRENDERLHDRRVQVKPLEVRNQVLIPEFLTY